MRKLTYSRARLIIWNPAAYTAKEVAKAAVYILGTLGARREDLDQATALV